MIEPCSSVVPPVALAAQGATDQPKPLILRPKHFMRWGKTETLSKLIWAARMQGRPVIMVSNDATQIDIDRALADLKEDMAIHKRTRRMIPVFEVTASVPPPPDISPTVFPRESAYDRRNRGAPFYRNIKRKRK